MRPTSAPIPSAQWLRFAAAALIAGTSPACAPAFTTDGSDVGELPRELVPVRDSIVRLVEAGAVPSAAIAVVKDGRIVWEEGFGWADKEQRVPATSRTVYRIASLTKPITATGVMMLTERGDLDLHRPANAYLGPTRIASRAGNSDSATIGRLLTHTGGLPAYWNDYFADEPYTPPSPAEVIRKYAFTVYEPGEETTVFRPRLGKKFLYSNIGFEVLGEVIGRVTGQSFDAFLEESVFRPLGMSATTFDHTQVPDSLLARGYDSEGHPLPPFTATTPAAGSARSSVHDLAQFMLLHLRSHPKGSSVLHDSTILEMQRARIPTNPPHLKRGLAWSLTEYEDGYQEVSHAGAIQGGAAWMNLYPREQMGVVVVLNQQEPQIALELAGLAAGAIEPHMAERLSWQLAIESGEQPPEAKPVVRVPRPPVQGRFAGFIHTPARKIPLTLVYRDGGDVYACLGDQPPAPVKGGRFRGRIDTPETQHSAHEVALRLDRRPDDYPTRLTGQAAAVSVEPRSHFHLPFWAELERQPDAASVTGGCVDL